MEHAICPECGVAIGGTNHQLNSTNSRAQEYVELERQIGLEQNPWPWGIQFFVCRPPILAPQMTVGQFDEAYWSGLDPDSEYDLIQGSFRSWVNSCGLPTSDS